MPTLAELRLKMPSLEGLDDANAVAFIHESYYPDLDPAAVAKAVGYAPPKPPVNQFGSGFGRSFQEVPGMVAGSGAYLADVVGATGARDRLLNYAKTNSEQVAKQHEGDAQSFMDTWDGKTPWADFLANAAGYVAGQALQSLASGGLGATAMRLATRAGAKQIAERAAADAIASGATEQAARSAASMALIAAERKAMVTGGAIGAGGQNLNMELGSIYPDAVDEAIKQGGTVEDVSKLRVGGAALAAAGIETATEAINLKGVLGGSAGRSLMGRAAREVPSGMLREAGTEAVQTGIEQWGASKPFDTREIIDSAAIGAVGGFGAGAAASLRAKKVTPSLESDVPPAVRAAADAAMGEITTAPTVAAAIDAFNRSHLPSAAPPAGLDGDGAMRRMGAVDPATGEIDMTGQAVPFKDRLTELRGQLADSRVRQQIRDTSGPDALNDVLYYAQRADDEGLPAKTSDRMLNLAEQLLFRAQVTKLPGASPQIGLSQAPPTAPGQAPEPATAGKVLQPATPDPGAPAVIGGDQGKPLATVATSGSVDIQKIGPFASADEASAYISQQRRNGTMRLPPAAPKPMGDGSFGITTDPAEVAGFARNARTLPATPDLLTIDGQPYGTKSGATARVRREGGGEVVPVPGGWSVRPSETATAASTTPGDVDAQPAPAGDAPAAPADAAPLDLAPDERITATSKAGATLTGTYAGLTSDGRVKLRQEGNVHYVDRSTVQSLDRATVEPAAAAARVPESAGPALGKESAAAAPANESDQDRSEREWAENYGKVTGNVDAATDRELDRAIGYAAKKASNLEPRAQAGDKQAATMMDALRAEQDNLEQAQRRRKGLDPITGKPAETPPVKPLKERAQAMKDRAKTKPPAAAPAPPEVAETLPAPPLSERVTLMNMIADLRGETSGRVVDDRKLSRLRDLERQLAALDKPAETPPAPKANTVFTEDAYAAARARMASKLGRLNSGFDPEMLQDGIVLAGYHIEKGARTFAAYAQAMLADMGEAIRPYLRSFYNGVRDYPGVNTDGMTPYEEVLKTDVATVGTQPQVDAAPAPEQTEPTQGAIDDTPSPPGPLADDSALDDRPADPAVPVVSRGARPPRARRGRADDRGVRPPGGRAAKQDDGQLDLGDAGGDAAVPVGPERDLGVADGRLPARDFRPGIGGLTREGSWRDTASRNVDIIELALKIEAEGRPATLEEQTLLSKYVGFGAGEIRNNLFPVPGSYALEREPTRLIWPNLVREGWRPIAERLEKLPLEWQRTVLQSTQYAHYTSEGIVRSVWSAMQRLGFTGGKILEPGAGIGSFTMLMPNNLRATSKYTGIEFDGPTALIGRLLSPQQNMLHADFIKRNVPRDYFDVAVGNPPFSRTPILADPDYEKKGFVLHDFFFAKSLDRVRPGGLLAFVTSHGTMDKQNDKARRYLMERADLVGSVRLPQTAFGDNAGTKVVTDVIFLRKRKSGEQPGGEAWGKAVGIDTKDGPAVVNEYFVAHPEMVLGQQRLSGYQDDAGRRINGLRSDGEYTVVSYDTTPDELDAKFAAAIERLPANVYSTLSQDEAQLRKETAKIDFDPSVKREGVIYLDKSGELMRVNQGVGRSLSADVRLSDKDQAWFKSYLGLRDLVNQSRLAQVQDGDWEKPLKALNKAYAAFVKQHGPINAFRVQVRKTTDEDGNPIEAPIRVFLNRRMLREDYDAAIVSSLERIDQNGEIVKAAFLNGRTIGKPPVPDVRTPGDALAMSLDTIGKLDLKDVALRIGMPVDEVTEALGNQVYRTPQGQWQLSDEYLSGNVREKLDEAEMAMRDDPSLARNVEALKAVQPERLGPSQISVKLGASWVKPEYMTEFANEIGAGDVSFDPLTESWQVTGGADRSGRRAGMEFGTAARSPSELLEAGLNSRAVTVKVAVDKKPVTDTVSTDEANAMLSKIKEKFRSWVWLDSERATDLIATYNERFNNIAPRRFDGSHLTLPGVTLRVKLHDHQKRAVWRQIQTGNTYLAHAVGAGKTLEMIVGGMEQKRLGLINKPIYVVPNHMLEQFSNEFMDAYPLANIMVADDENFSKERRKAFVAAATLNAPDAIVITHSAFERISVKEETVEPIKQEILDDLKDALQDAAKNKGDRVRRSQLEQQIEAVEQRFAKIVGAGTKDNTVSFEEMGVDFVYADEAHVFRKLDFNTNQSIKGIDPNGSKRALDMYVKTRYLEKQRPGRAMVFASGTPVTNTMGELYTIMRFFDPAEMSRTGTSTFDGWARQYGDAVAALEANAAGRYETVTRFAKFENVPELMDRIRKFMDVLTSDSLSGLVKRPDIRGGKPEMVMVEPTPELKTYMKKVLVPRLKASREWKPSQAEPNNPDPVIAIIGDGRFAALDPRFFGAQVDDDVTPTKLSAMADGIVADYKATAENDYGDGRKGGTQIVFYNFGFGAGSMRSRGFDARAHLMRRLMKGGVKRDDVIWFDDADTDAKKEAAFRKMRSGEARVLIGSAKKMGTGVNVQNRLATLHYFDPPWFPADVEQPLGRIIRQGNLNPEVSIRWYATKATYDSTMWQMVARKQKFIDQAFSGDRSLRSMSDMSEASAYEQAAALASGDPRALQLAGYRQDVERFERLQAAHHNEQVNVRSALRSAEWNMTSYNARLAQYKRAFEAMGSSYVSFGNAKVGKVPFDKQGEFGDALKQAFNKGAADSVLEPVEFRALANIGPATVQMETDYGKDKKPSGIYNLTVTIADSNLYLTQGSGMGADVDGVGLTRRVLNAINSFDQKIRETQTQIASETADVTRLRKKMGAPYEYEQELAERYGQLKQLEQELADEGRAEANAPAAVPAIEAVEQDALTINEAAIATLAGRTIEIPVQVGDTGKTATLKMDAAEAVRDIQKRAKAAEDLKGCL